MSHHCYFVPTYVDPVKKKIYVLIGKKFLYSDVQGFFMNNPKQWALFGGKYDERLYGRYRFYDHNDTSESHIDQLKNEASHAYLEFLEETGLKKVPLVMGRIMYIDRSEYDMSKPKNEQQTYVIFFYRFTESQYKKYRNIERADADAYYYEFEFIKWIEIKDAATIFKYRNKLNNYEVSYNDAKLYLEDFAERHNFWSKESPLKKNFKDYFTHIYKYNNFMDEIISGRMLRENIRKVADFLNEYIAGKKSTDWFYSGIHGFLLNINYIKDIPFGNKFLFNANNFNPDSVRMKKISVYHKKSTHKNVKYPVKLSKIPEVIHIYESKRNNSIRNYMSRDVESFNKDFMNELERTINPMYTRNKSRRLRSLSAALNEKSRVSTPVNFTDTRNKKRKDVSSSTPDKFLTEYIVSSRKLIEKLYTPRKITPRDMLNIPTRLSIVPDVAKKFYTNKKNKRGRFETSNPRTAKRKPRTKSKSSSSGASRFKSKKKKSGWVNRTRGIRMEDKPTPVAPSLPTTRRYVPKRENIARESRFAREFPTRGRRTRETKNEINTTLREPIRKFDTSDFFN